MTRLAFGLNWGDFGDSGLLTFALVAPSAFSASSNEARAIEPRPTPHCLKNQRRVISRAYSERSSFWRFMAENSKLETRSKLEDRNSNQKLALVFAHGFLQIAPKIRFSSLASFHNFRASSFMDGSAAAIIRRKNRVSLDSLRQVPMDFLKSFFETQS